MSAVKGCGSIAAVVALFLALVAGPSAGAGFGGSVSVEWLRVESQAPLAGDNLTVVVSISNNATIDFVLANLSLLVDPTSSSPSEVAHLENITILANSTTLFEFHWVAVSGSHVLSAQAFLKGPNGTAQPLPAATNRTSVSKPQIQEPFATAAGIGTVLLALFLIPVAPSFLERAFGGRRRAPPPSEVPDADGSAPARAQPKA